MFFMPCCLQLLFINNHALCLKSKLKKTMEYEYLRKFRAIALEVAFMMLHLRQKIKENAEFGRTSS